MPFGLTSSAAVVSAYALPANSLASAIASEDGIISRLTTLLSGGDTPSTFSAVVARLVVALVILVATALVSYFVSRAVKNVINRINKSLPTAIFVNIARVGIWCTGIAIILSVCFDVDPTGIIAALGVGGIAISLGLQDTIANIIGGLELSTMGTLKKGDYVVIGSTEGIVEDIAWRETTIVGFAGERTIVPNKVLNSNSLTVLPSARKVKVPIQIPNETLEAYRACGVMADDLGDIIAKAVTMRLRQPAPEGMGLALQNDAIVQFGNLTDFAASATVIVWVEEGVEFDRPEAISAITAVAADACTVDGFGAGDRAKDANAAGATGAANTVSTADTMDAAGVADTANAASTCAL